MRTRPFLGVLLALPLLLCGCTAAPKAATGTQSLTIIQEYNGVGPFVTKPIVDRPVIYWIDTRRMSVSLTTFGSSSCPGIPTTIRVVSPTKVALAMKVYDGACTADVSAYTSVFRMSARVSRHDDVAVDLTTTDPVPTLHVVLDAAAPPNPPLG